MKEKYEILCYVTFPPHILGATILQEIEGDGVRLGIFKLLLFMEHPN